MPKRTFPESELIINADGSCFHLHLKPEQLADKIILVGDPARVDTVAAHFDSKECKVSNREFHTITGTYQGKRITVQSHGIGCDNIDIVVNELDTLANIDYATREEKDEHRTLTMVRIGTCGGLQPFTPTGCFIASVKSIGFDGLLNYYAGRNVVCDIPMEKAFKEHMRWDPIKGAPYVSIADEELIDLIAGDDMVRGYTISCGGFYGPQGRILRADIADPDQNKKIEAFEYEGMKICNFEMESSALAGLASLLGHRAMTCCMAHSYTGEDSAEISCHGSRYILNKVLELLIEHGCRMANPGEYTQRAYLNGKMDLSQAEAVADLIASSNKATHDIALNQLRGHFSSELSHLREQLLKLTSLLELELDFSDHEDLQFADRSELLELSKAIDTHILRLATSFETGQALKNGIPVAIIGKTNVGKSTLLNRLLKDDRAIVSDIHGTTRDTIEDTIDIKGITFRFIDTAGIRQTTDIIEQIGIERTYAAIEKARIVIWLIDEAPTEAEISNITDRCTGRTLLTVWNKSDLRLLQSNNPFGSVCGCATATLPISAKHGQGLDALEAAIYSAANIPELTENDVIVTSARQYQSLISAHDNLTRVIEGLETNLSGDLISEDLNLVLDNLSDITGQGRIMTNEVLGNIFKNFCVGK